MSDIVTQADREAAATTQGPAVREEILRGTWDSRTLVQAFARHRIATTSLEATRIAKLEDALEAYKRFAGETAGACLGLAMSTDHPAPDEVLMDIFQKSQALAAIGRETALTKDTSYAE